MNADVLLNRALRLEFLSAEEGQYLFLHAPTAELMDVAHQIRKKLHPDNKVTWIIDRNVNTTNVCIANCKFCNFYRIPGHADAYITTIDQYKEKIEETFRYGGEQLLLQGGHHPGLGLQFYIDTFRELKRLYPNLKLHALGPPEIAHITKLEGTSHTEVLRALMEAGLDSLPGAGAEILSDRVRRLISKGKCSGREWLDVMRAAHQLHLTTSATMMFGHVETLEERFQHIIWLREVQSEKPADAKGFVSFIPWPFQDHDTILRRIKGVRNEVTG
ncbi:MAG: radical SAM protein, partial [Bacteroidota bacterium]